MNVTCPECRSMFRVDPSKVPTAGVRARCSICGGIITIGAGTSIDEEFDESAATPARATVTVAERETDGAAEPRKSSETPGSTTSITSSEPTAPVADTAGLDVDLDAEPEAFTQERSPDERLETGREANMWAEEKTSSAPHEQWRESPSESVPVSVDAGISAQSQSSEERAVEPSRAQEAAASSTTSASKPERVAENAEVTAGPATPAAKPAAAPVMGGGLPPTPSSSGSRPMFSRPPLTPPASSMAIPRSAGPVMPPLPAMPPARPPFAGRPLSGTGPLAAPRPSNTAGPLAVPPELPRPHGPGA